MTNQVRIQRMDNRCRFVGSADEVPFVQSELRQLAEGELADLVGAEVDRRLQHLASPSGIFHIRKLRLHLALPRSGFSTHGLCRALARQLVDELEKQLSDNRREVAFFASPGEFTAAFIRDLLTGRAWTTWYYEEFQALRHVSAQEAVVQTLLPRWNVLPAITRHLSPALLAQCVDAFDPSQARRLFVQWSGADILRTFAPKVVPTVARLRSVLQSVQALPAPTTPAQSSLSQAALRYFLLVLQALPDITDAEALLWLAAQRVFVARYDGHISALLDHRPLRPANHTSDAISEDKAKAIANALLLWVERGQQEREWVDALLHNHRPTERHDDKTGRKVTTTETSVERDGSVLYSEHAGLVLLMPVLFSLGLHSTCDLGELLEAFVLADGATERRDVAERWLQTLFSEHGDHSPQKLTLAERTDLPQRWRLGLDASRQQQLQRLQGAKQLAQLLLYHFAARLSGLQQSSNDYLRNQFLHRSGHFVFYESRIEAHITGVPLAIVLKMSGLACWAEHLPWLGRRLALDVSD